jgi:putative transposase
VLPIAAPSWSGSLARFDGKSLFHFVFFGLKHLDRVLKTWLAYYLRSRPHQGLDNELLLQKKQRGRPKMAVEDETIPLAEIRCEKQLGGLLKSYSRRAA